MASIRKVFAVILAGVAASSYIYAAARADAEPAPAITSLPPEYREWRLISVAHEEGKQNDIRAILGNDIAFNAARRGILPYPDGAIIARLAWTYVPSEENNLAFGQRQSYVAGAPTNVQFMIKSSKKYAGTGGWSFVQFNEAKLAEPASFHACFGCHVPVKSRDYVFNRYSP